MGVKAVTTILQWSQPILPHSSAQTFAFGISSPSSRRRSRKDGEAVLFRYFDRSVWFGNESKSLLRRSQSCEISESRVRNVKKACTASLDSFSDKEFSKKIQELARRFQLSDDDSFSRNSEIMNSESEDGNSLQSLTEDSNINFPLKLDLEEPQWLGIRQEPPDWVGRDENIPAIERKANRVDLPLSLRIIKRKKKWQEGFRDVGESAYCSVKKAFSSMVFIIQELHSYTLQMREILCYEDLQEILIRVQKEMHASFVWLFQQVFSHTPTLMVYVMILLANFTVHSMATNTAIAAAQPLASHSVATESVAAHVIQDITNKKLDSSAIKTFSVLSSSGKTTSIGGNNGGGGKVPPISSGTDGDGGLDGSEHYQTFIQDGSSQLSSLGTKTEAESVSNPVSSEKEVTLWNSIVEEASVMQRSLSDEAFDSETMQTFVSPVNAEIEADDYADTELLYRTALSREPSHPLLLANYAQFLYLVAHDYDRAEEFFKRATAVEPKDAEAFNKYAAFLWRVKNDLWAAEETFLEAISAEPTNPYYAANYAHFLWNTGGDDTCFPLSSTDSP